ncbi:MAG: HAD family hydrolase [Lachnospiraceae bacterium]|nr:HAD family hydrolase [Lachnospiraceae bacterium]
MSTKENKKIECKQIEKKEIVLFDLDGTLTNPMIGITKSVQYALKKFGIEEPDLWNLTKFIGPPLMYSFETFYGFSKEEAAKAVEYYREYYSPTGIFENKAYDGMKELLESLKSRGMILAVATSKPEEYAIRILDHFEMSEYFTYIGGALMNGRTDKAQVISYVLETLSANLDKTIMVGDREHDILGAKKNHLDSIGVLYGYGNRQELEKAGADWIVADVDELREQLIRLN